MWVKNKQTGLIWEVEGELAELDLRLGPLDDLLPFLLAEARDPGLGHAPHLLLGDSEVRLGESSDLRQVADDDDLMAVGQRPQSLADDLPAATTDPYIDLVEDQRRRLVDLGEDRFDR